MIRRHSRPRRTGAHAPAMAFGLCLLVGGPAFASVGVYSTQDRLWVFHVSEDASGQSVCRLAYRSLKAASGEEFRRFPIGPLLGRPRFAAAAGDGLHVFFNDGTHRRYYLATTKGGVVTSAGQSIERSFPHASLPAALAVDDGNEVLFAVISDRQLRQLESDRAAHEALALDDEDHFDVSLGSRSPRTKRLWREEQDARVIVRYEAGEWVFDRTAPVDMTLDARVLAMAVHDGSVQLLFRQHDAADHARLQRSPDSETGWSDAIDTALGDGAFAWSLGRVDESLVLLETAQEDGACAVSVRVLVDERWRVAAQLLDAEGRPPRWKSPPGLLASPQGLTLASVNEHGEPGLQRWSIDGGGPIETLTPLKALTPPAAPVIDPSLSWMVEYALLAVVLTAVFVGRRERVLFAAPLKPTQAFASLPRRALALAIDLVILAPVFFLVFALWFGKDQLSAWMQWDVQSLRDESLARKEQWFRDLLGLVVGLYSIPFEIWLGATPGKRLAGCAVVDEAGERCSISKIVYRNLARAIEFHFLPLAALVLLTPARQRVGDLIARTVVIQRSKPDEIENADENTP